MTRPDTVRFLRTEPTMAFPEGRLLALRDGQLNVLAARVTALGRRARPAAPPVLERAGIRLDPHRREVFRDGRYVPLSRKEFAVLTELLLAGGAAVSAEQLLEKARDEYADPFTHTVRMTILKLRRKLGEPPVVLTDPGVGYRIS